MVTKIESTKGKECCLLFLDGEPYVRVYDRSNNQFSFKDYRLRVDDLTFRIESNYFAFVEYDSGMKELQYRRQREDT